jgi:hypothetical protein
MMIRSLAVDKARRERRWTSAAGKTGKGLFSAVTENKYFFLTV